MSPKHLRVRFSQPKSPLASSRSPLWRRKNFRIGLLLVIFLAVLAAALFAWRYDRNLRLSTELRYELALIRNALTIYVTRYGEPPPDLETLTRTYLIFEGKYQPVLEGVEMDGAGRLVDPFGYNYTYDMGTSTVYSSAPCCKNW